MTRLSSHGTALPPLDTSARRSEDRRAIPARQQLVTRVRGEFAEMPCLSLTIPQSVRLFHLREDICTRVLDALVAEGVLWRRDDGRYAARPADV